MSVPRLAALLCLAACAVVMAQNQPKPEPPQPQIAAGFATYNVFWPFDTDEKGTVYPCTCNVYCTEMILFDVIFDCLEQ